MAESAMHCNHSVRRHKSSEFSGSSLRKTDRTRAGGIANANEKD
jgi:hypothetical protein